MNEKYTYTGDKVKNHFTAYLLEFIRGRRAAYLDKKIKSAKGEYSMEEIEEIEERIAFDEIRENEEREKTLLRESQGHFPRWSDLSDDSLVEALLQLREDERRLIYQHVFEEKTFDEMSQINGMASERCKGIYYYAIRKIRKRMGVKKNEL